MAAHPKLLELKDAINAAHASVRHSVTARDEGNAISVLQHGASIGTWSMEPGWFEFRAGSDRDEPDCQRAFWLEKALSMTADFAARDRQPGTRRMP